MSPLENKVIMEVTGVTEVIEVIKAVAPEGRVRRKSMRNRHQS